MFKKIKGSFKRISPWLIALLLLQPLLLMPAPVLASGSGTNANALNVYSFGFGNAGQLGHGVAGSLANRSTPTKIDGLSNNKAIAGGEFHSLALTVTGEVYSFGRGQNGRLGHVIPSSKYEPTKIVDLSNIKAIAGGESHSLALAESGEVYSFGAGWSGELGHGNEDGQNTPLKIAGLSNIKAIAAGSAHSLALTVTGEVYSFGYGGGGQLGHGNWNNQNTPLIIDGLSNIKAIAAGGAHSLALTESGEVYSFGYGEDGQLGHGNALDKYEPTIIAGLSNIKAIAAGSVHSLALTESGEVYSFGSGFAGKLGHGNALDKYEPTIIAGLSNIKAIAAGDSHSLALTEFGEVYSFGAGGDGQLGHGVIGSSANRSTPTKIEGLSNVETIAAGYAHSLVAVRTIAPSTASFDKHVLMQQDIAVTIDWKGNTLDSITNGTTSLTEGTDYIIGDNIVTITKAYMATLSIGTTELEFAFSAGDDATLSITISDSTPANSTITPVSASFDKYSASSGYEDIEISLNLQGNTFSSIGLDGTALPVNVYELDGAGDKLMLKKEYLATLANGLHEFTFKFSAGDDATLSITINDSSPMLSADADLTDLQVDGITVDGFAPANLGPYAISITHSQTAVAITYTTSSTHATVQVTNVTNLAVGDNMITVTVTAQNGDTKAYLIEVVRAAAPRHSGGGGGSVLSSNTDLQDLQIWIGDTRLTLSPTFNSETLEYTAYTEEEQVEIVALKEHFGAKLMYENEVITDSILVDLEEGVNVLNLTIQAENGMNKEYTLHIYRESSQTNEHNIPDDSETPEFILTDIVGHWAESEIKHAVSQGIINGYPDGTFKPNNLVTRAEFTAMFAEALQLEDEGATFVFTDQEQIATWAKGAVIKVVQAGMINGYEDGSFRPDAHISRAEMASMIAKALSASQEYDANTRTGFADDEDIPKWAKGAVEAIRTLGIVKGRSGNQFAPNETATRAEAVVMLLRLLELRDQP